MSESTDAMVLTRGTVFGRRPVGFVLVRRLNRPDQPPFHAVAEFFVLRKYRRRGVGTAAARLAFDRFPGKWTVSQDPDNPASRAFWERVIGDYTGDRYRQILNEDGEPAQVFETRG